MNHEYFMEIALDCARAALSKDEFPVGCVITYKDDVVVTRSRTGTAGPDANEVDHAEMQALRELAGLNKEMDPDKMTLFTTLEPCLMCFGAHLLSRIGTLVYAYEDVMGGGTKCDLSSLTPLYRDSRVSIVPNILRDQSLDLFKRFFGSSGNSYWKGSRLAEYTLNL